VNGPQTPIGIRRGRAVLLRAVGAGADPGIACQDGETGMAAYRPQQRDVRGDMNGTLHWRDAGNGQHKWLAFAGWNCPEMLFSRPMFPTPSQRHAGELDSTLAAPTGICSRSHVNATRLGQTNCAWAELAGARGHLRDGRTPTITRRPPRRRLMSSSTYSASSSTPIRSVPHRAARSDNAGSEGSHNTI